MSWRSACDAQVRPGVDQHRSRRRVSTKMDGRSRVSRGSAERQVAQSQPIIGTPCDVPVPRKVISSRRYGLEHDALLAALLGLDEAHPQLVQQVRPGAWLRARRGCPRVFSCSIAMISIICPAPTRFGSIGSPVAGSAMSPKCTAAVVASEKQKISET